MRLCRTCLWAGLVLIGCEPPPRGPPPPGSGGSATASGGLSGATGGGPTNAGGASAAGGSGGSSDGGTPSTGGSPSSGGSGDGGSSSGGAPDVDPSCAQGVWQGEEPAHVPLTGNTFAHDPTMIEADGTYYRFWTGDFIPVATSTDLAAWSDAPSVYDGEYPSWVEEWLGGVPGETFNFPWAPDVSSFGGQVHLYSTFSAKFGDNISCITHLSTPDLGATPFEDHGPVVCTEGSENYNAIDADVGFDDEGTPWLAFGSFWDGIMALGLEPDGSATSGSPTNLARASEIEAPVLLRRCGYYYLFVSHGLCCPGEGRSVEDLSYRVVVGRSDHILGPYFDKNGAPMTEGGGTLVVEGDGVTWAAAGHSDVLADGGQLYHLYHAYRQSNGAAELRLAGLWFDDDGWPVPHAP
jgi:arabinan endo-1,5-alpha-L-arabinosidase